MKFALYGNIKCRGTVKACPHQATKLPKGNKVAENGNKLLPETELLAGVATMLPFRATIVAWCG